MKQEYTSKHAKQPAAPAKPQGHARAQSESRAVYASEERTAAPRRNTKKSGTVIAVLLLIILAAAAVLAAVWFLMLRPDAPVKEPVPTQAIASTPEPEPTAEPTPAPTPEPTPVPATELVYTADYESSYDIDEILASSAAKQTAGGSELSLADGSVNVTAADGSASALPCDGYPGAVLTLSDGRGAFTMWTENSQQLCILNDAATAVETTYELPNAVTVADGADNYSFFYSTGVDFYGVELASGKEDKLFNWTDVGVSGSRVSDIMPCGDNTFACVVSRWNNDFAGYEQSLVDVSGAEAEPGAEDKTQLVLLSANPVDTLQDAIVAFNRSREDVSISLRSFDGIGEGADLLPSLEKFAAEELNGVMPDLIDLTGLPYEELAAAGKLEDLYPFLDADGELSRESILPAVRTALELDGKLYGTSSGFTVSTVLGPGRLFKGKTGWTMQEFSSIASTMGEGTYVFGAFDTQSAVLYDLLGANLSSYINWKDKTCSFESGDFTKLLEFIKKLPAEPRETDDSALLQSGVQLLDREVLFTVNDLAAIGADIKNPVVIGYPAADGKGNVLNLFRDFAVSASCQDKEAAWQFIRTAFTSEYQSGGWIFPSNASAFEDAMQASSLDEEQQAALRAILENARASADDPAVFQIVVENIEGFLAGRDTAAGAAALVQQAVSGYLASIH